MASTARSHLALSGLLMALALLAGGCTSPGEWVRNGFKVGPNSSRPPAPIAQNWIDAADVRVRTECDDLAGWWTVFNDPVLNGLVQQAYSQNLTLREAGFRVLAARAQLGFAIGNIFPQFQTASGGLTHFGVGDNFFDRWNAGFNLSWELDFWGRFRRAIESADATLGASVADYDDVLVTLLADVASNYVRYRTAEERIRLLSGVIEVQQQAVRFTERRLAAGAITDLDNAQAISNLKQSLAALDLLQIERRLAQNQLCILMGMPITDLTALLDSAPRRDIPVTPDFVVVGIPADLLRRRPDVRRAERQAAAQAEQIGIAVADLYPAFAINGTLGWQASSFSGLFNSHSLNSNVGPAFQWNLLNYGRIRNNVRFQDALFRQLVAAYQQSVLQADLEVENGIINFLQSQERAKSLNEAVQAAQTALDVVVAQYQAEVAMAKVDFNRYTVIVQTLIQQQDQWAQARGQIAQGLIETYRALGGGWQLRLGYAPDKRGILSAEAVLAQPEGIEAPPGEPLPLPPAR
jgi:NodT family efflux transporter outer membrane factor (OMF) lipoprotein